MSERRQPPVYLFPGLAADGRLFDALRPELTHLRTPAWLSPYRNEPLRDYALRMAQVVRKDLNRLDAEHAHAPRTQRRPSERYFLGGFSFGGQVAMEMVHGIFPKPSGIILLCGVRGPAQILSTFKRQQCMARLVPYWLQRRLFVPYAARFARREGLNPAQTQQLLAMARDIDPSFLAWSSDACARWDGTPRGVANVRATAQAGDVPVFHLHGEHDTVVPDVHREATRTLMGAKHLITLTHPREVGAWLRETILSAPGNPPQASDAAP